MTELLNKLGRNFDRGYQSEASNVLYKRIKKSPEEISLIIRDAWDSIKIEKNNSHIISHFLYLLATEVKREWIQDISFEIVEFGLNHHDAEVLDMAIGLVESWNDIDILNLLHNTEIKTKWLQEYKDNILKELD